VALAEGQEGVFFLTRHHSGAFHIINPMLNPTDTTAVDYKDQLALVKRSAEVLAEPVKALKAEKATDRLFAATVLVHRYRSYPANASSGPLVPEKLPAEESKLILKAFADGDWKSDPNNPNIFNAYQTFSLLGITEKDGFQSPLAKPNEDFVEKSKGAFVAWLAGPGKEYRVSKLVPRKK
jgi:hypothetical protein